MLDYLFGAIVCIGIAWFLVNAVFYMKESKERQETMADRLGDIADATKECERSLREIEKGINAIRYGEAKRFIP